MHRVALLGIVIIVDMVQRLPKKKSVTMKFYPQDLERADRLTLERETRTALFEAALQLLFDVREGRAKVSRLSSLT